MNKSKKLSNSFSTGGGGVHFEAHVQACFVALMLTGGHAPCLPCWPIAKIKLQGKINGFDTDDLVVFVEEPGSKEQRKLLGQVKSSIDITEGSEQFGEVMQAAWNDFNNPKVFTQGKDVIALITGPLSATDRDNVRWLLDHAKCTENVDEFFKHVWQANYSPPKSIEKLNAIQYHLKAANGGNDVSRDELYDFLNHFHLLDCDLGNEFGVVLSLLHSHISQSQQHPQWIWSQSQQHPQWIWSRIVDVVQIYNKNAGTITPDKLPEDLLDAFRQKAVVEMPDKFKAAQEKPKTDWTQHPDATYLALAVLIGAWNEKNPGDLQATTQLLGMSHDEWLKKAREILHCPGSPLSLGNGIWNVADRAELWRLLGSRIHDQDLDAFRSLAVSVLKEPDPAFELPVEKRWVASIHGKELNCSRVLRKGIADGLAILGSQPNACSKHCSQWKAEATCALVIRELLIGADWILWGSLNDLLPTLAEAAPGEFLDAVEKAMRLTPCPFDELFSQEGDGITGGNYLTGLLWALEGLAWDEPYLVRVCVALGELASHDPGGRWANRPSNSLATILLPWLPQTLASVDKRKAAVETVLGEWPDIGWNLIIQLLTGQISLRSHKPKWRKTIPDDWKEGAAHQEYWQASFCAERAVAAAGQDAARLSLLIDHFDNLPRPAFEQLLQTLASKPIAELPEEQRLSIWEHLANFARQQRRLSNAERALPDELIARIEHVAEQLAPANPFNLHQHLFADSDFDLYEKNVSSIKGTEDWHDQQKKLDERRETAIWEIFQQNGAEGVIRFAESVACPVKVGRVLGVVADSVMEGMLLPSFLDSAENKRKALASGFVGRRCQLKGWNWCDGIDKSDWTPVQVGKFLVCLPFAKEAWDRASAWLKGHEREYWTCVDANQVDGNSAIAIEKLIEHGRPLAAIVCLGMRYANQPIDANQCVRALLAALSSSEPSYDAMARRCIVELIKFLQAEPSVNQDDLFRVEWAYVPLLDRPGGAAPQLLESRLANDPEFFCEVIRLIYRSKKEDQPSSEPTEESRAIATTCWRLLHNWKTPPGTQKDGTFSKERFAEWLQRAKEACTESGHLEVALRSIGNVLIHAPPDPDGLWMHRAVAAALNDREADDMRKGFTEGTFNSRGTHYVDPTGNPEKELAEQFRSKADEIENAGFHRVAVALRALADKYDRKSERIVAEHRQEEG